MRPGFTATVVVTLALGIGANAAMFSVIRAVLLRPLPYRDPDRLVVIWTRHPAKGAEQELVSPADYADWMAQNTVFDDMAFSPAYGAARLFNLQGPEGNERIRGAAVSASFFRLLGVAAALGRTFLDEEDRPGGPKSAVLSHSLWMRRFGGERGALGRTLTLDSYGLVTFTVVGVMPPGFGFPDRPEIWIPTGATEMRVPPPGASDRCCRWFQVFARLKPGVGLEQARAEMRVIQGRLHRQYPAADVNPEVSVVRLLDQLAGPVRLALFTLEAAVASVLLIACANIAGLLMAQASARRKEFTIRAALGAGRLRLLRQSLVESLTLALAGGLLGLGLAAAGTRALLAVIPEQVPRLEETRTDGAVLLFALSLAIVTGLIFGLLPAIQAARGHPGESLGEGGRGGTAGVRRRRWRGALVVGEIALAVVLTICAGLLIRSFRLLGQVDPGFRAERVLAASIDMSSSVFDDPSRRPRFFDQLMARIRALHGVVAVGGQSQLPLDGMGGRGQTFTIQGRPSVSAGDLPTAGLGGVTPDGFRALGIALLAGRVFTAADGRDAPRVVMVNQTLARRYWSGPTPLGQRLVLGGGGRMDRVRATGEPNWREIVGIVADVRGLGLDREPRPEIFVPHWQWPWHSADLVARTTGDPRALASTVRAEARALEPNAVVTEVRTMEQIVSDSMAHPRFRSLLLGGFSVLGLLLAAVGIFGLMSTTVAERTREIGIRLALGAPPGRVRWLVVGHAMGLTMVGVSLGLASAASLTRLVSRLLFGVGATDWPTFAAAAVVLAVVAAAASYLPARRATQVDPVEALRYE